MPPRELNPRRIPISAQPRNHRHSLVAQKTLMSELLPRVHITQMHFHKRDRDPGQRVPDRDRSVRVGTRVDDDHVDAAPGFVDLVDDAAFVVGLVVGQGHGEGGALRGGCGADVREGFVAVDVWFSRA